MIPVDALDVIRKDPRVVRLGRRLAQRDTPVVAAGLWGSSAPILAAIAAGHCRRPLLYITAHEDEADDALDDIVLTGAGQPLWLPQLDAAPGDFETDAEALGERLRVCVRLSDAQPADRGEPLVIVASVHALMQPVPSREAIREGSRTIAVGQRLEPAQLVAWLTKQGFERTDQVGLPGDFAQRGGIIDIYSSAHADPVRIEFFGDEVESLRLFDAGTQRSTHPLDSIRIPGRSVLAPPACRRSGARRRPAGPADESDATASFLSLLPADTIIALHEPAEIQELGRTYWQQLGERAGIVPVEAIFRRAGRFSRLHLQRFDPGGEASVDMKVGSLPPFEPRSTDALGSLAELARDHDVVVCCDNQGERRRLEELLNDLPERPARVVSTVGVVHRGFVWGRVAFVPHHELFHRYRRRRTLRKVQPARPIDSFFDLDTGDYVVHALHGIGRFRGLKTLERSGRRDEYLAIEFAGHAVVHVPVSQIHVVQKYIGSVRGRPRLSKLGGSTWKRTKRRVAEAVTDLAAELLALQAERAACAGIAYPPDTRWQQEFEESFLYTETEDQLRALAEIKQDLSRPRPMDRLLCGDVGFGKTELAIRAAFKVIEYGKQVAVLVPTTVLAEQHYRTFCERLADYPFTVEVLSRFRTAGQQRRIIERAARGGIDILIGTHRLLSKDVRFADLGLVVIDEEQRFGVEAKERLKRLRASVEVLTLSATPIPRTLHMSLLGIREISSLATPPMDRRAIVTQVRMWDDELVRSAILRELHRDGQVYFVHNFVRDIHTVANRLRALVPEARVVVGHGRMNRAELEEAMTRFVRREADVLVSTNIIESGIDIPTANTIFIDRAERFGLADLHQLRGRVGRSRHRAYCYLLLSPRHAVKDDAARRLKAVEQYAELGAGFQIAMRDLEIRGAGNILGPEQSGHIEAVGYEMYCQLLEQAVRKMRNEPPDLRRIVALDLGITASIPRSYVPAQRQRMEVYKRLAGAGTIDDVRVLSDDLRDAYGPLPDDVQTLLALAEVRVLAGSWGIRSIVLDPPDVVFSIDDLARVQELFAEGPGSPRLPDAHTVHWRLGRRYLEPPTLLAILRKQLGRAASPARADTSEAPGASAPSPLSRASAARR